MQKIDTTIALLRDMAETEPREGYKVALENAANLLEGNPTEEMYAEITEVMKDLMPGLIQGITDVVNSIAETLRTRGTEILPLLARALAEKVLEEAYDE